MLSWKKDVLLQIQINENYFFLKKQKNINVLFNITIKTTHFVFPLFQTFVSAINK